MSKVESLSESSFRLTVTNISKLEKVSSPIHVIQDIPWQINVFAQNRKPNNNKTLGIALVCATSDSQQAWSQTASCSFQLVPFEGAASVRKHTSEPQVFNRSLKEIRFSVLDWHELTKVENHFVKDDTIQLDININAVDPNDINQSMLIFENTSKCCENDCLAEYKLTVVNIRNLLAVRSTQFLLRGLLYDFIVYKDATSKLAIKLATRTESDKVSCKIYIATKLTSSSKTLVPVQRIQTHVISRTQPLVLRLMAWDILLDAKNGYINDDAITLQIELKVSKPEYIGEHGVLSVVATAPPPSLKMECAICMEAIHNQNLSCPPCGHVFCTPCLTRTANKQHVCPTCDVSISADTLRRVFLPM